jgi:hypothetical protein
MWALAPSIMALQSLEPMATPPGLGLGGLPPRQASAAAVAAAEDLQKQPAQTQQVPPGTTQTASPAATVDASHVTTHTLLQQVLQRLDQQQQQQPQQQQQQQLQPELDPLHSLPADLVQQLGPVDVVYLWVNGSDPVLTQELRQLAASRAAHSSKTQHPTVLADNPLRQARFDSGRDELSYSLRSLEMHMPWFRNVYIVTNGQVRPAQPADQQPSGGVQGTQECLEMPVLQSQSRRSHQPTQHTRLAEAGTAHMHGRQNAKSAASLALLCCCRSPAGWTSTTPA